MDYAIFSPSLVYAATVREWIDWERRPILWKAQSGQLCLSRLKSCTSLSKTQTQLKLISHDSNTNFELFLATLLSLINEIDDQRNRKSACDQYQWASIYSLAVKFSNVVANHSQTLGTIRGELIAYKMAVHNCGYNLDDSLSALAR